MNQQVTFLSDGGESVRDLQILSVRPNAEHVLEYFHVAMRITVLQQMIRGLPAPFNALSQPVIEVLDSVRRYLWYGNVRVHFGLPRNSKRGWICSTKPPAEMRKLRRYVGEFIGYISSNVRMIRTMPSGIVTARWCQRPL